MADQSISAATSPSSPPKAHPSHPAQVLDHILPPSAEQLKIDSSPTDPALWSRVDAIVLQWIYGTISEDLLNTILERDSTAALAWARLRDIFSDNKTSRALYLEQEFSKVQMEDFGDASSYCQHLKSLSDQLSNVGAPVSNERLVLQLLSGLTDAYAGVGSQIRHGDTLPLFYKARSMLVLEETARTKKAAQNPSTSAFFVAPVDNHSVNRHTHNLNRTPNHRNGRGGGGGARGGRHRGRTSGGRGNHPSSSSRGSWWQTQGTPPFGRNGPPFIGSHGPQQPWAASHGPQQPWAASPWAGPWPSWATPPCPYPTVPQPTHPRQPGLLGPRPPQAHMAATPSLAQNSYAPTDIQAAMHTLSMVPPDDQWYMDTGATSHMTAHGGFSDGDTFNEM